RVAELGNLRAFARMTPAASAPEGVRLVCLVTEAQASSTAEARAYKMGDQIPTGAGALTDNIYQYSVTAAYDVMPLFNFAGVPLLAGVPGLGAPVPVRFTATSAV